MADDSSKTPSVPAAKTGEAPHLKPRPADPCAMVLFGATGDLAKRLVVPALYNLATSGTLPDHFALIGVARGEDEVESWRKSLHDALQDFAKSKSGTFSADKIDAKVWDKLSSQMSFVQGDLTTPHSTRRSATRSSGRPGPRRPRAM